MKNGSWFTSYRIYCLNNPTKSLTIIITYFKETIRLKIVYAHILTSAYCTIYILLLSTVTTTTTTTSTGYTNFYLFGTNYHIVYFYAVLSGTDLCLNE